MLEYTKKVYTHCATCKQGFVKPALITGKLKPAKSAYPVCMRCLMKDIKTGITAQKLKLR